MKSDLIIACAGAGKTTYIIKEALKYPDEKILITTYTENNTKEIIDKIIKINQCVPANITVLPWFTFLLRHGVRPYQGSFKSELFDQEITGTLLTNQMSGIKFKIKGRPIQYSEKEEFLQHYFSPSLKIYVDKLSKFVFKANEQTNSAIIKRLEAMFSYIYIDEIQDLSGYDLELIWLLIESNINLKMVGDPRQVTYLTHHERKNKQYIDGKIGLYISDRSKKRELVHIDEDLLSVSHRNNADICSYSSGLYPNFKASEPCSCPDCHKGALGHEGVFLVRPRDVDEYLARYKPVQLRYDINAPVKEGYHALNMGVSKGMTFDRVLIYPTKSMIAWIKDNSKNLGNSTKAKFYVAITRAKHSCAIIVDYKDSDDFEGALKYCS